MNVSISRRDLLKLAGAAGAVSTLSACATTGGKSLGNVVIIGGGFGGATAAKYLRLWGEGRINVTLIERNASFISCPMSNLVIGGSRKIDELTRGYDGLKALGVNVILGEVSSIDTATQSVQVAGASAVKYDRLIVAPGVDFNFSAIEGFNAAAQDKVMHAWKAGAQTVTLRNQLTSMADGGVVAISIPKAPYRCPPGPYERACQVAHYLKANKPKSKVIILDANEDVQSKKGLFTKAWNENFKGLVEYRNNWEVKKLDAGNLTVESELGDSLKASVLNVIPPMRAGDIAQKSGLITTNNRWCDVDWVTMESKAVKNVHVLGDATLAAPAMPKSGHMANQHGKAAAAAIVELMSGRAPAPLTMANTCYSFIDDANVVHVASVHRYDAEKKTMVTVPGSGGLSAAANELEGAYGWAWAQTIWDDMLV